MASRQNSWWSDLTTTETVYRRRGAPGSSVSASSKYKGYRVWEDENGWHTSLDPGSWFDTKKDVTRFIDSWEKSRSNPRIMMGWVDSSNRDGFPGFHPNPPRGWFERCVKAVKAKGGAYDPNAVCAAQERRLGKRNALPLATLASEAPGASGFLGSSEKWLKKHKVMRSNLTDRALRYRAVKSIDAPKICNLCGSKKQLMVGHVNGNESDTAPENLFWTCRSCNTLAANAMQRAGVGRLTHQYNPQGGAKSVGQWLTAVTSMKGENGAMSVPDAVAMIRATSPAKRSEFASEIWKLRKGRANPMSKSEKDRLLREWEKLYNQSLDLQLAVPWDLTEPETAAQKAWKRKLNKLESQMRSIQSRLRNNPANPEAESATAFESFHGYHPSEQITVEKDVHYHSQLWAVGKLEKLSVLSPDGVLVDLSGFQGAMLSANEANTQLYIEGGDQAVDLSEFDLGEPYHDKEDLGEVVKIWYFTNKTHLGDQGGEAVYHHKFGEEKTKRASYIFGKMEGRKVPRPRLAYDVVNQALEFIGGEYLIEPEGIRN